MNYSHSQRGVVGLYLMVLILMVTLGIGASIATGVFGQQRIVKNTVASIQAYYAAEAGIEDALLRVQNSMSWTSPYVFQVGSASTTVTIPVAIGGVRTITAQGDATNRLRGAQVIYQIDADNVSFNFGAQIGDGGMEMRAGSKVVGNVFSNGTIFAGGGAGAERLITDTAVIARNGSKLDGITVGDTSCPSCTGDVRVHTCVDSTIKGTLTYVSGGSFGSCTAGAYVDGGPGEIDPAAFPITPAMITDWKNDAAAGGIIDGGGDVTITANRTLGPGKITGDLTTDNNSTLTLAGTVWVTGDTFIKNGTTIRLDASYGDLSGMLIGDGEIFIRNGSAVEGTSSPFSFLMLIGLSSSTAESDPAMEVKNTAQGAILFTPNGLMVIDNTVDLVEATTYQLLLKNNATITYDIGLANTRFTSGPSGGWVVSGWKEIE